ncbi:mitochondrial rho GTPase 1-like protein, partial [Trifolium pratense]
MAGVNASSSKSIQRRRPHIVRTVVAGDSRTGKSSLIHAAAGYTVGTKVFENPVLPPYFDATPITLIDTSSRIVDTGKVDKQLKQADSVVLTYACDRPETLQNLTTIWLPRLRRLQVKVPVIVVGCKLDLQDENQQ